METIITPATNVIAENEEGTAYKAIIDGTEWSGIHPKSRFWANVQKAIEDGAEVTPFIAPPVPDLKIQALKTSDTELLSLSARTIEDIISDRIADGKFVAQSVKDVITKRVNLRK